MDLASRIYLIAEKGLPPYDKVMSREERLEVINELLTKEREKIFINSLDKVEALFDEWVKNKYMNRKEFTKNIHRMKINKDWGYEDE